ncbi:MAG: SDR family oxidoreductase, partial [Gammaproteobacteria bacterium]
MSLNPGVSDWQGLRVWLIGASSGIGKATAEALLQEGARVALTSRNEAALQAMSGPDALVAVADVTDRDSLRTAFDRVVDGLGGIDL